MDRHPIEPDVLLIALGGPLLSIVISLGLCASVKILKSKRAAQARAAYPANTVILHQERRGPYAPSLSPFPIKLETYLRMAKIPYKNDIDYHWRDELGKIPSITFNGEDIADSQVCIEVLNKKCDVNLNKDLNEEEQAIGRAFRTVCEDHLYWALALERWQFNEDKWKFLNETVQIEKLFCWLAGRRLAKQARAHGMGRHKKSYVQKLAVQDLLDLNTQMGNRKFLMGNEPCEYDASVFGMLVQIRYQLPGTCLEKAFKEKCKNLMDYVDRMRERFWPDWEECAYIPRSWSYE